MGLDQCIYSIPRDQFPKTLLEKLPLIPDDEVPGDEAPEEEQFIDKCEELGDWRKWYELEGFMLRLWIAKGGEREKYRSGCGVLMQLNEADLEKIEAAEVGLVDSSVSWHRDHYGPETAYSLKKMANAARKRIAEGCIVFYWSC